MDHDDEPVGRVLTQSEIIALFGVAGAALVDGVGQAVTREGNHPTDLSLLPSPLGSETAAPTIPSCIVRPAQPAGPFCIDEQPNRSDIRIDSCDGSIRPGVLLHLRFNITQITANACTFLQGAYVDVWHCDAAGKYSEVESNFLRGCQVTNALGTVEFLTIYPGSYPNRTVHIHFRIRTELNSTVYDFMSQIYFDDALTDQVLQQEPYASQDIRNRRNNNTDDIYQKYDGAQLMLTCTPDGGGGYSTIFNIGLAIP